MLQKYESGQLIPVSGDLARKPAGRFHQTSNEILVKWYKPQKRTIIANGCRHHLAFPYMVFIRIRGGLKVVLTLEPPTLDSLTYACPLSNIFVGSSDVCLDEMEEEKTFENMIDYFWNSGFGDDRWYSRYLSYSKWPDMDDVLNPEHWIRQSEYHERFQRENFLGFWLSSYQYFSIIDANKFASMIKFETFKDILTF